MRLSSSFHHTYNTSLRLTYYASVCHLQPFDLSSWSRVIYSHTSARVRSAETEKTRFANGGGVCFAPVPGSLCSMTCTRIKRFRPFNVVPEPRGVFPAFRVQGQYPCRHLSSVVYIACEVHVIKTYIRLSSTYIDVTWNTNKRHDILNRQ